MRSETAGPPGRFARLAPLALAALAACSFDLELPGVASSPRVSAFTPGAALAGQLVRVTGSHFAATANENTVNFANASARAERLDGADLLVRVPPNAGDGPITVANLEGTSRASDASFDYLGLGEPGRLQVASSTPILQHPRAVLPFPGPEVALDSGLFGGLLFLGNPSFATPTVLRSAGAPELGLAYYAYLEAVSGKVFLDALDVASATKKASIVLPGLPKMLLHLAGRNVLLALGEDAGGFAVVAAYNASTLGQVLAPVPYGVEGFWGAVDLRDGRVVVAGFDANYALALYLLDLRTLPTVPTPVQFGCAGSYTGSCPPALNTSLDNLVPLAATGAGAVYVAAALDDGDAVIASFSTGVPAFETRVDTFSPTLIESIVAAASTPDFVATKPADDLALAFGPSGALHWFVDAAHPTVSAAVTLPATASLGTLDYAFIAGDGDDNVVVVDMATGQRVSRISFEVRPGTGTSRYGGAAAFMPSATGGDGDVIFPATAFPGLVRLPTGTDPPTAIARTAAIQAVAVAPETATLWAAASGAPPQVEGWVAFVGGTWTRYVRAALAADPQRIAARGTTVVVGHGSGLSLIDSTAQQSGVADVAAIPGVASPSFYGLGFTPEGNVWALVTGSTGTEVQLWAPGAIVPGGLPTATWTVPLDAPTAAWLEDGLWIFGTDANGLEQATLLGPGLAEVRTVRASDRLGEIHAISPNGRLLVCRESTQSALGFAVRFFRADPDAGFPEVGSLVFSERVEALTFDANGERLYLLTQVPDSLVTID
ncbi:MAG TPA: hypothetical protein VLT47_01685 [Anaeromyxobacteraceae bacterium]|nr:hypothetical protein [Anaeromyxobacteraceae bacterium]